MLEFKYSSTSIKIDLKLGVYRFPSTSADGKTYLARMLRNLGEEERVNSYTLEDKSLCSVATLLDNAKYALILLDRYDMYFGDGLTEIEQFGKYGVVLIDCKSHSFPFAVKACVLRMRAKSMEVTG